MPPGWSQPMPAGWSIPPAQITQAPSSWIQTAGENALPRSIMHPILSGQEDQQQRQAHPVRSMLESYPPVAAAEGLYGGAKRSLGEIGQGIKNMTGTWTEEANPAEAASHFIKAIPIAGPAIANAADKPDVGGTGSYLGDLKSTLSSPSAMGTLAGAAAQIAPFVAGGADMAAPNRSLVGQIPTRARAGAMFDSLNKDLAQQPVTLKNAAQPLQRATEIGVRGSALPKAVGDLLTRSQSPIDMTFPEARDYQGSLSDLSMSDRLAMNGRMRGAVKQLNKNFFSDIQDAAGQAGRGEDYAKAMNDYRNASRLRNAAKIAIPAAAVAAGGGKIARYLRPLIP